MRSQVGCCWSGAGIEWVFERQNDLTIARKLYRTIAKEYPGRVVIAAHSRIPVEASDTDMVSQLKPRRTSLVLMPKEPLRYYGVAVAVGLALGFALSLFGIVLIR